jgi:hypothetical protein
LLDAKLNARLKAELNDALNVSLTKESPKYLLRVFYYYGKHNYGWRTICGFDSLPTWDEMKNAGLVKEPDDVRRQYIIVETKTKKSVFKYPKEGQYKAKRRKTKRIEILPGIKARVYRFVDDEHEKLMKEMKEMKGG